MATFLFDDIIFGPVKSRRLGNSLGINLLPTNEKVCNFNCVYCECGLSFNSSTDNLPAVKVILDMLDNRLQKMLEEKNIPDSITFAGNGEPTLHPDFLKIMQGTVELRNRYFQKSIVSVLTNASLINRDEIRAGLDLADQNIIKLDSTKKETVDTINCPDYNFNLDSFISNAKKFKKKPMLQTLFLRGTVNGKEIDNTTAAEIKPWLEVIETIQPQSVMIYTIARDTALSGLNKVNDKELHEIGKKVESLGFPVIIST